MELITPEERANEYKKRVLTDLNECDSTCTGLGMVPTTKEYGRTSLTDWLIENIPGIYYGLDRTTNYIFSNGLATGDEAGDERLDDWLYEKKNRMGATNYSVLREAIRWAHAYGESGLRYYDGALYAYKQGYFGLLVREEKGIEEIVAYYIRKDKEKVDGDIKDENWGNWDDWDGVMDYFDMKNLILLDPSEFQILRNDTATLHGVPTLLQDRQRVKLLLSAYQRLNYDIDYDGPGRIFFWEEGGYTSDDTNEVPSTTELLNNSPKAKEERSKKAREEIEAVAKEIKAAGSDAIGILSKKISKDHLQIPRVTKATEFFGWLDGEGEIVAQLLGMSSVLLEVGDIHANVSMEKLIDNAMLNTIIPLREKYAIQFSEWLASKINVPKVYFDKYDLQQVKNENEEREKVARTMSYLSTVEKNTDSETVSKLINDLAEALDAALYDSNGVMRL